VIIEILRKEPLVYLDERLWEYMLSPEVKSFLNTLDEGTCQVWRLTDRFLLEFKNYQDENILMFKLLFGEYL
jgi:hypothetical protein